MIGAPYHTIVERDDGFHVALVRPDNGTVTGVLCCSTSSVANSLAARLDGDMLRLRELLDERFKASCEALSRRTPAGFYSDNEG